MTGPAKDAHHAYHVALGTLKTAVPFEELPVRVQQAWEAVAGVTADHLQRIEAAEHETQGAEKRCAEAEERLFDAQVEIETLTDRIKELQAAEAKAAAVEPAAK